MPKHKKRIACKDKIKHKTKEAAYYAKRELLKKGFIAFVYKCKGCGYYHIGKPSIYDSPILFWKNIDNYKKTQNNKMGS